MWIFYQTGTLVSPDGIHSPAYSGSGAHQNDPDSQHLENLGPLPCGIYRIGDPYNSPLHGPLTFPLTPDSTNEMFGRHSFLIHGDKIAAPGTASEGCIVAARSVRDRIPLSGDRRLEVRPRPEPVIAIDPGIEAE